MTDEGKPETIADPSPPYIDGQLQFLVDFVNGTDDEIGVTLTVGGVLITGVIASAHRYFDAFADAMVASMTFDAEDSRTSLRDALAARR